MILQAENKDLLVKGRFPRIVSLEAEYFEWLSDPYQLIETLRSKRAGELFTFLQKIEPKSTPQYDFYFEWDSIAVLPISSYDNWWNKQIRHETRVKIRKALKHNIEVRVVEFDDEMVQGIKNIYDESPVRQGKRFRHYMKSLEVLRQEQGTFLDRSEFIGAFYQGELIGFVKLVHDVDFSAFMQVISMVKHRDKAPTNALVAKAVEICAERGAKYLTYGTWSKRGLGDFKKAHAFEPIEVPRYFIPLNLAGKLALRLKMHKKLVEVLPASWVNVAVQWRNKLNARKFASLGESSKNGD